MPVKEHQIHMQPYPVMSHTLLYGFMTLKLKTKTTINSEEKKTFSLNIITSLTILHISHLAGDILMSLLLLNVVYMHVLVTFPIKIKTLASCKITVRLIEMNFSCFLVETQRNKQTCLE